MIKWLCILAFIIILFLVSNFYLKTRNTPAAPESTTASQSNSPSKQYSRTEVIATSLEVPWAIAFLPNNDMLITERSGRLRIMSQGKLDPKPLAVIAETLQTGEGGLHGVAVDPKFTENRYIYLYHTYSSDGNNTLNKVVRFRMDGGGLNQPTTIVDKIPGATIHDGGRLKFGPDGALYITTGDAANPSLAQDKDTFAGKILRYRDNKVEVYSLGHRNPQGITWDKDGNLWEVEHGQTATDELNLILQGNNYGWPTIKGDQQQTGLINPKIHSGNQTWAPGGIAYLDNKLYFGGLRGQALLVVDTAQPTLKVQPYFQGEFGRIRDVVLGPDKMLYITTSNRDGRGQPALDDDKIIRVDPNQL